MNTTHMNDDPLALRYELGAVLAAYEGAPSPATAFAVAAAVGKTRLFGINPGPGRDGRLPPAIATAAADGLEVALPGWLRAVRKLDAGYEGRWRTEGDEDCIALLEARVAVWGALVAVRETAAVRPEVAAAVARVQAAAATFDLWLRAQERELSAVVGLPLLTTWQALLVPPHRDPLPWWLDGSLEAAAARVRRAALVAIPSALPRRIGAEAHTDAPVAAAKVSGVAPSFKIRAVRWVSPDGQWTARLNVPEGGAATDQTRRPINFEPAGGASAAAFPPGTAVRIGCAEGLTDSSGQFRVSIAELNGTDFLEVGGERWYPADAPGSTASGERS